MALNYQNTANVSFADTNDMFQESAKLIKSGFSGLESTLTSLGTDAKAKETKQNEDRFTELAMKINSLGSAAEGAALKQQAEGVDFTALYGSKAQEAQRLVLNAENAILQREFDTNEKLIERDAQKNSLLNMEESSFISQANQLESEGKTKEAINLLDKLKGSNAVNLKQTLTGKSKVKEFESFKLGMDERLVRASSLGDYNPLLTYTDKVINDDSDEYSTEEKRYALELKDKAITSSRTLTEVELSNIEATKSTLTNKLAPLEKRVSSATTTLTNWDTEKNKYLNEPYKIDINDVEYGTKIKELFNLEEGEEDSSLFSEITTELTKLANDPEIQKKLSVSKDAQGNPIPRPLSLSEILTIIPVGGRGALKWDKSSAEAAIINHANNFKYRAEANEQLRVDLEKDADTLERAKLTILNATTDLKAKYYNDNKSTSSPMPLTTDSSGIFSTAYKKIQLALNPDSGTKKGEEALTTTSTANTRTDVVSAPLDNEANSSNVDVDSTDASGTTEEESSESTSDSSLNIFDQVAALEKEGSKAKQVLSKYALYGGDLTATTQKNREELYSSLEALRLVGKEDVLLDRIDTLAATANKGREANRSSAGKTLDGIMPNGLTTLTEKLRKETAPKPLDTLMGKVAKNFKSKTETAIDKEFTSQQKRIVERVLKDLDSNASIEEIIEATKNLLREKR